MLGGEEGEEEGEEEVELKHLPGKKLPKEVRRAYKPRPIMFGYRMREKDCNFKIQGSLALEDATRAHSRPSSRATLPPPWPSSVAPCVP